MIFIVNAIPNDTVADSTPAIISVNLCLFKYSDDHTLPINRIIKAEKAAAPTYITLKTHGIKEEAACPLARI